jgi:hypothetical protein
MQLWSAWPKTLIARPRSCHWYKMERWYTRRRSRGGGGEGVEEENEGEEQMKGGRGCRRVRGGGRSQLTLYLSLLRGGVKGGGSGSELIKCTCHI